MTKTMQPRTITLATTLNAPVGEVERLLRQPATLVHISAPLLRFEPVGEPLPATWRPGTWRVRLRGPFGVPLGWQDIRVSFPPAPEGKFQVRDDGHGALARQWDHLITIEANGPQRTRYQDTVTIEAGWLTLPIAAFARLFYAHRQRRWRALLRARHTP